MRQINQAGIDLIKSFESLKLEAYPDPGTKAEPYTIGYGHTGSVKPNDKITLEQAENLLKQDLSVFCSGVEKYVKIPISDNQFAALVSFSFNEGLGNLHSSTLLKLLNQNKAQEAANEFEKWNKSAGHVLDGLTRRRLAEKALFLKA